MWIPDIYTTFRSSAELELGLSLAKLMIFSAWYICTTIPYPPGWDMIFTLWEPAGHLFSFRQKYRYIGQLIQQNKSDLQQSSRISREFKDFVGTWFFWHNIFWIQHFFVVKMRKIKVGQNCLQWRENRLKNKFWIFKPPRSQKIGYLKKNINGSKFFF